MKSKFHVEVKALKKKYESKFDRDLNKGDLGEYLFVQDVLNAPILIKFETLPSKPMMGQLIRWITSKSLNDS